VSARYAYPSLPPPPGLPRAGFFMFNAKKVRDVIGGALINDTTTASATIEAGARATLKTYTFTTGALANRLRIRIYGRAGTANTYATVYVNLNNVDAYSTALTLSTSEVLLVDAFINVSASTPYILKIDLYNGVSVSVTYYITRVYIYVGYALTSTTETTLASFVQSSECSVVANSINVKYSLGFRYRVVFNRKTTATATLKVGIDSLSIAGADDGDTYQSICRTTGSGNITVSGYVGADGDVIIIISIRVQYVLKGSQSDSRNVSSSWCVVVQESGYIVALVRYATFDDVNRSMSVYNITLNGAELVYTSASGSDVTFVFEGVSAGEMTFYVDGVEDSKSYSAIVTLVIMVMSP